MKFFSALTLLLACAVAVSCHSRRRAWRGHRRQGGEGERGDYGGRGGGGGGWGGRYGSGKGPICERTNSNGTVDCQYTCPAGTECKDVWSAVSVGTVKMCLRLVCSNNTDCPEGSSCMGRRGWYGGGNDNTMYCQSNNWTPRPTHNCRHKDTGIRWGRMCKIETTVTGLACDRSGECTGLYDGCSTQGQSIQRGSETATIYMCEPKDCEVHSECPDGQCVNEGNCQPRNCKRYPPSLCILNATIASETTPRNTTFTP